MTKNEWTPIIEFASPRLSDKWTTDLHPEKYLQNMMVSYDRISEYKKKFVTLEDIAKFEKNENDYYLRMCKSYYEMKSKFKGVIY